MKHRPNRDLTFSPVLNLGRAERKKITVGQLNAALGLTAAFYRQLVLQRELFEPFRRTPKAPPMRTWEQKRRKRARRSARLARRVNRG